MEEPIIPNEPVNPVETVTPSEPTIPQEPVAAAEATGAPTICPECSKAYNPQKIYCNHCGYPVNGTHEQKSDYEINKFKLGYDLDVARRRIKNGSLTLYILAGLLLFVSLILLLVGLAAGDETMETGGRIVETGKFMLIMFFILLFMGGIFLGLGLWARTKPFAALLTATIFYVTLAVSGYASGDFNPLAFIIQVVIIIALVRGTMGGYEAEQIKRKLHID